MIKRKGYKYRIYPNESQEIVINKTFGSSRKIHNLLLNEKEAIYELFKDYPELLKSHTYLTPAYYKTIYPYLKEVDSQALTSAWLNLKNAFNNFYKGTHKYPRYKSKKNMRHSYTSHTTNNNIRLEGKYKRELLYYMGSTLLIPNEVIIKFKITAENITRLKSKYKDLTII